MAAELLATLDAISKRFASGTTALDGTDLEVFRGEFLSLLGPSGCGKSTLLRIIAGLSEPSSGVRRLSLTTDRAMRVPAGRIGFVFQNFNLLARTTALENVELPLLYSKGITAAQRHQRAKEKLALVGLAERMDHEPSKLSGGQQQRVAIARSLINDPPILFADEPTGNLDSKTSKEILTMFQALAAEEHITIILVTHDAGVGSYAGRTIRIADGLIEAGAFAG